MELLNKYYKVNIEGSPIKNKIIKIVEIINNDDYYKTIDVRYKTIDVQELYRADIDKVNYRIDKKLWVEVNYINNNWVEMGGK